jgi:glutaredoxin 3
LAKVLLFSTSTCSWCRRAKRYFKEQGVAFKEINIERDPDAARDIVRKTGQRGNRARNVLHEVRLSFSR